MFQPLTCAVRSTAGRQHEGQNPLQPSLMHLASLGTLTGDEGEIDQRHMTMVLGFWLVFLGQLHNHAGIIITEMHTSSNTDRRDLKGHPNSLLKRLNLSH